MNTIKKITFALIVSFWSQNLFAQQAPMYTHYMYNTLEINPAYAGSRDALTVTALDRAQWIGFKGAPVTQTITMHAPILNEHIGVGLSVLNDKIGPTNNTSVYADFAFIMRLTEKSKLALGFSAGTDIYNATLNTLGLDQQVDPAFQNNVNNKMVPNFGFGAYYSRERFYAGFSAPNLFQSSYAVANLADGSSFIGLEQRHYFLIAGTLFNLTDNLAVKPTTFIKITPAAPIEVDFTASFIIAKTLLAGIMFRTGDAVGILAGFDITDQLHIGYSFDWSYGLKTSEYNQGSHELVLRYDFMFIGKKQIHSPRYF